MSRAPGRSISAAAALLALVCAAVGAQARQPPAYVLSGGDKAIIILGEVPKTVAGFTVERKGPGDRDFSPITEEPVRAVEDPFLARELIGRDFEWVSRRVETMDPDAAWRRIRARPELGVVLSFASNGLRMALGRTYFDLAVSRGQSYQYRVVLLDSLGKEAGRIEKQLTISAPRIPREPAQVTAAPDTNEVTVTWNYPRFQGGDADLTVGFNVLRQERGKPVVLRTPSPVLRIEGMLRFVDSEPLLDTPVTYSVQSVDLIGTTSDPVSAPEITLKNTTPPMAPQGVTAVDRPEGVLVVWKVSPESDTDHYIVYKSGRQDSGYERISPSPIPVSQPRFLDSKPVRGVVWYYKVSTVGKNGIESAMSGSAPIIPQKTTPPPPVQGLTFSVDPKQRSVSLAWSPVGEPDLKGYLIFRGASRQSLVRLTPSPLPPTQSPSFEDSGWQAQGLPSGRTLVYAVSAIDTSLNQGAPAYVEVPIPDTAPPSAALSLSARSTPEGRVSLSWQPSLSRNLAAHRVQRKKGGAFATVAELPSGIVSWVDDTVEAGRTYTYRIIEVSGAGVESAPSAEAILTVTSINPPAPPGSLAAELTPKGVSLQWSAPPSAGIRGYLVYRAAYEGAQFTRLTPSPVPGTTWLDPKGQKESFYAVSAVDASGNEGQRAAATVKASEPGAGAAP